MSERAGKDGMSGRTLPEELHSVLLAHALQAPDPDDTIHRVLAATSVAGPPHQRRGRPRHGRLLVAAVVVAALAGAGALAEHRQSGRGVNRAAAPPSSAGPDVQQVPGHTAGRAPLGPNVLSPGAVPDRQPSAPANPPAPAGFSCAALPGSRLDIGSSAATATGFVYDFRCLTADGRRSASTVVAYSGTAGALVQQAVLVPAATGAQVDLIRGAGQGVVVDMLAADRSLLQLRFTGIDHLRFNQDAELLAPACVAADLTASLGPAGSAASSPPGQPAPELLRLTKRTSGICVLSGFPAVSAAGQQAWPTLRGPAGGTGWPAPEIVQVAPSETVSALVEPGSGCVSSTVAVTLPGDVSLGELAAGFGLCGAQVHPIVPNERGSD
ncbi:MAG TPA: hypothetical protein VMB79_02795 [Jatrophihabitans sp.]|nr:hypothetical protein [Jatrophihabitans sp.]